AMVAASRATAGRTWYRDMMFSKGKKGKRPGAQGDTNAPHCRRCGIITALHGQAGTLAHTRNTPDSIAFHDLWTLGKAQFRPYFGQTTV
ncbi:MAG TPA: hypothetical protein PLY54_08975, partial [Ottowia sp.]|nr:hypothetical protein [Ottowia sp.]